MTGVLHRTQEGEAVRLRIIPDQTAASLSQGAKSAADGSSPLQLTAPHALVVSSTPEARARALQTLISEGLDSGRSVAVVLRTDAAASVLRQLDSTGIQATAAVADGRLHIGTAQQLGLSVDADGATVAATAVVCLGRDIGCVVTELDAEGAVDFGGGAATRVPGCSCVSRDIPRDVSTTCLLSLDGAMASIPLAALDEHPAILLDGRPIGGWATGEAPAENNPSELVERFSAILPLVNDPVRLAELGAGMAARLADAERAARLCAENSGLRAGARTELRDARLIQAVSVSIVTRDIDGALGSLSELLECRLALVDADGRLVAGSAAVADAFDAAPWALRTDGWRDSDRPVARPDGTAIMAVRGPRDLLLGYLCLEADVDNVDGSAWESLAHLLVAAFGAADADRRARDASEGSLVLALVRGNDTTRFEHRRWAGRLRIDLERAYRVIVLSTGPDDPADEARLDAWSRAARSFAGSRNEKLHIAKTPEGLVCLRLDREESSEDWAQYCRDLSEALRPRAPSLISVGSPGVYPTGLAESHDQARRLAELQRRGATPLAVPQVAVFEQTGLIADMLGASAGSHLVPFVRRVLGPLFDDTRCGGQLVETLGAYLASGGSPAQTAERLHLHRSSVKYRVNVLREVIGDRLDDPDRRFELDLAIRLLGAFRLLGTDIRASVAG